MSESPEGRAAAGFLAAAEERPEVRRMYDDDVAESGYVMNLTRVWAHQPDLLDHLSRLLLAATAEAGLSFEDRGVLVSATASSIGDSYCSLAWGSRLAGAATPEVAATVLRGSETGLDDRQRALARWARAVATGPATTTDGDVDELRKAGFTDSQVVAVTAYVAGRIAFSTVNAALGARPDPELRDAAPPQVREAVDYGRPVADG